MSGTKVGRFKFSATRKAISVFRQTSLAGAVIRCNGQPKLED